ncbi:hypothetical protein D0S48_01225 [Psychrobacillus sp. AK 1817]|uniref:glycerophosphodiester phosphodiesterase n=1 Tax=Psychrobacillus sp. AK 1817 TaxID=2303505 RepID=UPI001248E7B4|nr:glycerophosphodiester phosphodiesterase family protein [Psychrobacillus sp. AK 1817]QEY19432.1 hypothetical protein D0S48_01225 [Psychrobacillus sp. AK 1817]
MSNLPVYAHRGGATKYVENSLRSFEYAKKIGVDGIEMDLQLSADGVAFVTHDLDFFRLAGINRRITDMAAEEILQLKLGKTFLRRFLYSRVLSFDDFLSFFEQTNLKLNVEFKESFLGKTEKIEEVVYKTKNIKDVHFSSFEESILETIQRMPIKTKTAFIGKKNSSWDEILANRSYDAIHLNKKFFGTELMDRIWEAGFPMRFYNIKGTEKYLKNPPKSVIGWITDFPLKVIEQQNRL